MYLLLSVSSRFKHLSFRYILRKKSFSFWPSVENDTKDVLCIHLLLLWNNDHSSFIFYWMYLFIGLKYLWGETNGHLFQFDQVLHFWFIVVSWILWTSNNMNLINETSEQRLSFTFFNWLCICIGIKTI